MAVDEQEFSALVATLRRGDSDAQSQLAAIVYPELRRLARRCLQGERAGHTLQTTELVHEAWLRLFSSSQLAIADRAHLFALMATQMRRVLVDYARQRNTAKGQGSSIHVGLDEASGLPMRIDEDMLAIDQALNALQSVDAHACRVVELRFFDSLVEDEIAAMLGISVATLKRDQTFARAWLYDQLNAPRPDSSAQGRADQRPGTNDQRPTTNDQRLTTND